MSESCETCKFFSADYEEAREYAAEMGTSSGGCCVRYPPENVTSTYAQPSSPHPGNPSGETRYHSSTSAHSPRVFEKHWCGEYREDKSKVLAARKPEAGK